MGLRVRVAIIRPVHTTFDYGVPEHLDKWTVPGVRCLVPFGNGRSIGFVLSLGEDDGGRQLKEIVEILDLEPAIPPDLLQLGVWIAAYYHHPVGEVLAAALPPAFRIDIRPIYRPVGDPSSLLTDSPEARLWATAQRSGVLRSVAVAATQRPAFDILIRSGLLTRDWDVPPSNSHPGVVWYGLNEGAPSPGSLPPRAHRMAEALRAIAEGPVRLDSLTARGVSRDVLARAVLKGWVRRRVEEARVACPAASCFGEEQVVEALTEEQALAVLSVSAVLGKGEFSSFLLHGVTGSGKTEVYIRAVAEARRRGLGAVVLVPEISLTPQFLGRFVAHFGTDVAVLHSGLGARERRLQWDNVRSGRASIAIGTRSAVFAPVGRLGIVVVDEEHEPSYKQEEGLRYHAKHVALQRARLAGAVALLGSATPDVETYWGVKQGRYRPLCLSHRAQSGGGPSIEIVDLRQEERRRRSRVLLSEPLRSHVDGALGRSEQVLLFLNRRGFSPALVCSSCGEAVHCPRCSVSLTLHGRRGGEGGHLICHYCSIRRSLPEICPSCGAAELHPSGAGTQRLTEVVREAWPAARIVRLDRDVLRKRTGAEVLGTFHKGDADILIGTQMVAKGHHFPRLSVVGVVDADLSLNFPDFRAAERTFQVLTQVSGRAGRTALPGVVVLQTRNPCHPVLNAVRRGDFASFAKGEIDSRRDAGFPPFRRLALLGVSSTEEQEGRSFARALADDARELGRLLRVEVLGPSPAPLERVRGRYRFQVLLKAPGPEPAPLQEVLRRLISRGRTATKRSVRLSVDVDPVSLL